MKHKYVVLLGLILVCSGGFAQIISFAPSDTVSFNVSLTDSMQTSETFLFVTNTNPLDTIMEWKPVIVNEDSAWSLAYCDPDNCYYFTDALSILTTRSFSADTGVSYKTYFSATPNCGAMAGELQILMWLENDSAASARYLTFLPTYTGNCVTGIQQTNLPDFKIYPTPLTSELNIEGLSNLPAIKITLYDIIGNTIIQNSYTSHADMVTLNTSALHAGIYFLSIESNGQRVVTRRVEKLN